MERHISCHCFIVTISWANLFGLKFNISCSAIFQSTTESRSKIFAVIFVAERRGWRGRETRRHDTSSFLFRRCWWFWEGSYFRRALCIFIFLPNFGERQVDAPRELSALSRYHRSYKYCPAIAWPFWAPRNKYSMSRCERICIYRCHDVARRERGRIFWVTCYFEI